MNKEHVKEILLKYDFGSFVASNSSTPLDLDSKSCPDPGVVGCYKKDGKWITCEGGPMGAPLYKNTHSDQLSAYIDVAEHLGLNYAVNVEICAFFNHYEEAPFNQERYIKMADFIAETIVHIENRDKVYKKYGVDLGLQKEVLCLKQALISLRNKVRKDNSYNSLQTIEIKTTLKTPEVAQRYGAHYSLEKRGTLKTREKFKVSFAQI